MLTPEMRLAPSDWPVSPTSRPPRVTTGTTRPLASAYIELSPSSWYLLKSGSMGGSLSFEVTQSRWLGDGLGQADGVAQQADSLDLGLEHVAVGEEPLRVAGDADASGGAGEHQVSGAQDREGR